MSAKMYQCNTCGKNIPHFSVTEDAFNAVVRALYNRSQTIAAAELKHYVNCSDAESQVWVEHLLACTGAWPTADSDALILKNIDHAFSGIDKPEHFTNFTHCDECKEHDDTLRNRTVATLQRSDLGEAGWDPINFCDGEGIAYFFPALARYALLPDVWRDHSWYGAQLLFHLSYAGQENKLFQWCSTVQRKSVLDLIKHMEATRSESVTNYGAGNELMEALTVWGEGAHST